VLLLIGTIGVVWWGRTHRSAPTVLGQVTYRQVTFSGDVSAAALSPDGHTAAYAVDAESGGVRVLVRDLTGGPALEIWKGRDLNDFSWTPDGTPDPA
jgi:Tol biopolymer transport system component